MDIKHRGAFESMDVNDYSVDLFEGGTLGTKKYPRNQQQITIFSTPHRLPFQGFHGSTNIKQQLYPLVDGSYFQYNK